MVARVELHHGIGHDVDDLGRIGIGQPENPRAAGCLRSLVQALHDLRNEGDLLAGSGDNHTVGRRVGHDAALGGVFGSALALEQIGGERGGQGSQRRRIGLLEFDDLHFTRLDIRRDVQFADDLGRGLNGGRFAGDYQAVAAGIDEHLHGLGLGAEALFNEARDV